MSTHLHIILWGFCGTILLTTCLSASRSVGLTRMDMILMLGTLYTSNRARAMILGFTTNLILGFAFAYFYAAVFQSMGMHAWWFGALIGLCHALFVLCVGMVLLPSIHPRMASENYGPDPTRQLEPPGFMALHYGRGTPLTTIVAHLAYGVVLAIFYQPL